MISNPIAPCGPARVLLVEDETKLRESIAEGLRLEEWDVAAAATAAEALQQLAAQPFDLVVLDWMLPDRDGLAIVEQMRAHGLNVPVLMITARASHADEIAAFRGGVAGYLSKPFSFVDLLARCRLLLAGSMAAAGETLS